MLDMLTGAEKKGAERDMSVTSSCSPRRAQAFRRISELSPRLEPSPTKTLSTKTG
jgi:hypothetical protein